MIGYRQAMATGRRRLTSLQGRWVRAELTRVTERLRDEFGCTMVHCGMAIGGDHHWGFAALAAGLDVYAHIPFVGQDAPWPTAKQEDWRLLRRKAVDEHIYGSLDGCQGKARSAQMNRLYTLRNVGMVRATQAVRGVCIAIWDGKPTGGTWHAIQYATKARLPLIVLDIVNQTVRHRAAPPAATQPPLEDS